MGKRIIKLSQRSEECFRATSDWTGALITRAIPSRNKNHKSATVIKDRVETAARRLSEETGIALEEIVEERESPAYRNRLQTDFVSYLDFDGQIFVRSTRRFDNFMEQWGALMLDGFKRLGSDLSFLGVGYRENLALIPNLLETLYIDRNLIGVDIKDHFISANDNKVTRNRIKDRIEDYLRRLEDKGFLASTRQKSVGEGNRYQVTPNGLKLQEFYMNVLYPLIAYTNQASKDRAPLTRLGEDLRAGEFNYKYFYIEADAQSSAAIIDLIRRHEILNGKPYLFHTSHLIPQPIAPVHIYINDLRGRRLDADTQQRLVDGWKSHVSSGTVIAVVDEAIGSPRFEDLKPGYRVVTLPTSFTRESYPSPPGVIKLFQQAYNGKLPQATARAEPKTEMTYNMPSTSVPITAAITNSPAPETRFRTTTESPQMKLERFRHLLGI